MSGAFPFHIKLHRSDMTLLSGLAEWKVFCTLSLGVLLSCQLPAHYQIRDTSTSTQSQVFQCYVHTHTLSLLCFCDLFCRWPVNSWAVTHLWNAKIQLHRFIQPLLNSFLPFAWKACESLSHSRFLLIFQSRPQKRSRTACHRVNAVTWRSALLNLTKKVKHFEELAYALVWGYFKSRNCWQSTPGEGWCVYPQTCQKT